MKRLLFKEILQRAALAVLVAVLLSACAANEIIQTPPIPELSNQPGYDIESIDPLAMSAEMKQFVDSHLGSRRFAEDRAWKLAYAALDPWVLDFEYDPHVTLTAREAFRTRRGNCLAFSNMFIAMARYAGLNAWYREVEIDPEWNSREDTLLVSLHVNAATRDRGKEYVIDVSRRPKREGERHRVISDREAEAQFYNNLGANALVENDLPMAYAYFRKAEETVPGLPYIWSNLGVVLNRNDQVEDAILVYNTALQLDARHTVSLNNLYSIYEERGELEKAQKLQQQVERNRRKNPFYLHYLSELAFSERLWDEAIEYANRAIRLEDGEYSFYYTLAQLQFQTGELSRAESNLRLAEKLAPEWVDTDELVLPGKFPEFESD
ncbi:MAG: transglutaminase domain-containing protein [Xanthomonadales bacterium]|jgi:tetratricopeptide (TPR) repeat protein|nr:transglutaminase domain-containing protein [Xanthomonadales bacterium]